MVLALFGFMHMSLADVLDIILVALIILIAFRWIKGSAAMSIFVAIVSLYIIRVVVAALNMKMTNALMETVLDVGMIALIVIFQPEIRRFLIQLGNRYLNQAGKRNKFIDRIFGKKVGSSEAAAIQEIADACKDMSQTKTGALIVLPQSSSLQDIMDTGDRIDAKVSRRLILNLFFKNSPLHDGAVIIAGDRIAAARCTLPITDRTDIPAHLGMRHKAAIGISEQSDAKVVVVSEETGTISFVEAGVVTPISNVNELKLKLNDTGKQHTDN